MKQIFRRQQKITQTFFEHYKWKSFSETPYIELTIGWDCVDQSSQRHCISRTILAKSVFMHLLRTCLLLKKILFNLLIKCEAEVSYFGKFYKCRHTRACEDRRTRKMPDWVLQLILPGGTSTFNIFSAHSLERVLWEREIAWHCFYSATGWCLLYWMRVGHAGESTFRIFLLLFSAAYKKQGYYTRSMRLWGRINACVWVHVCATVLQHACMALNMLHLSLHLLCASAKDFFF